MEKAFKDIFGDVVVRGYCVEGVVDQPIGLSTTIFFARYRAKKVMEIDRECDFYVGIEAGITEIKDIGYFDIHVACVIDKNGLEFYGFSPAFMVPKIFVDKLISNEFKELEDIVDLYFGTKNIGEKGGLISLLTKGVIIREDLIYYSVATALIPLINLNLYSKNP